MPPILREFPVEFESARLHIRAPLPGDGEMMRTAVLASLPELQQWMPWAMEPVKSIEGFEVMMREWRIKFLSREDLPLVLVEKESNQVVGSSGLHRINWDVPKFEIGYWLHTAYTGKGYMTEAVTAITQFAFTELEAQRVEIRCDALNHRSAAIPQRLGFVHEATLHKEARHHLTGKLRDTLIFAKLRDTP